MNHRKGERMAKGLSRRGFLQAGVVAGVAFHIAALRGPAKAALIEDTHNRQPSWIGPDGRPRFRMDAVAKVTGDKSFSRDYRAKDMPGWPKEQSHAFFIHAGKADHAFEGVDLAVLGDDLKPDRLVLGDELIADGLVPPQGADGEGPGFYGDVFLVPPGETPRLLGQPVALLIYDDFARYDAAKRRIRFDEGVVKWGAYTGPNTPPNYAANRYVRIGGAQPSDGDVYSPMIEGGVVLAGRFEGDDVVWPDADADGDGAARAMAAAGEIEREITGAGDDVLVLTRDYHSQSVDASAMEADNGNVWYDLVTGTLRAVIATQSPYEVVEATTVLFEKSRWRLTRFDLSIGYTVGYGSKDHSIFPFFAIVAALYAGGRPVRLANDRFEQFRMGLKRHPFWIRNTIVVDRTTGAFRLLRSENRTDCGGRRNFSPEISNVGTTAAQSIYYFPKSDLSVTAMASRAVDAGSMRGYGTLQTMMATEMLVDEVAEELAIDPIALRQKNLFRTGMKNTQGAIPGGALRAEELLARAREHPLWRDRAARKVEFDGANPGKRYGVGFAQVQKDFGNGADAAITTLTIDPAGRLAMRIHGNDMGTGMDTSQAVMVANVIGRVPDTCASGVTDFPEMPLVSTEAPYSTPQEEEDRLAANPRWTPAYVSSMAASNSVYFLGHATRTAARALLRLSLWPAAVSIWSRGVGGGQFGPLAVEFEDHRIVDGALTAGGLEPLPLERLAAEAHAKGLVTGVSVHVFNRWQWATASFDVPTVGPVTLAADGLSVRYGEKAADDRRAASTAGGFHFLERTSVQYPPVQRNNAGVTYYTGMATIAEVVVDTATGEVKVTNHHSVHECGTQIMPALVSGQIQGGIAMGIGHALYEELPLYEGGPGDGTWNWNRYRLPHAKDVAVWAQTAEVLPPISDSDPPKGMAEVAMIPVVPAIANAVAHAIGTRFYETPITAARVREVLS
jgi:CO/xanthine dehydrogenase Mo-binding subunit